MENRIAGVWVKASERLPIEEGQYFVNMPTAVAKTSFYFNGKRFETYGGVTIEEIEWLDESQPIPVNDWENLRGRFFDECTVVDSIDGVKIRVDLNPDYLFDWFKEVVSQQPIPVNQDEIIKEFSIEIAIRLTKSPLNKVDYSDLRSVAKAVEKTLRHTIFTIHKEPGKTYEPWQSVFEPIPVQEGLSVWTLRKEFSEWYFGYMKDVGKPPLAMQIFYWFDKNVGLSNSLCEKSENTDQPSQESDRDKEEVK